jgi:hypothetical protein
MTLTRRQFIGATAAAVAAAELPGMAEASVTPLAGATVNRGAYDTATYLAGAKIFNSYVGLPLATRFEKVYMDHGEFGTTLPDKIAQLAPAGCSFLVSVKPSTTLTKSEQSAMAKWLAMLKAHGIRFRCVLYSEPNDKAFLSTSTWLPYWRFYAPVILNAGVTLVYEPGCGPKAISRGEALFPSKPSPDEMWLDYYASAYKGGSRLGTILSIGASAGVPVGLGEWGWAAGNSSSTGTNMTMTIFTEYGNYLLGLIAKRKITLGAAYFNARFGSLIGNIITGPADPRIPMIKKMAAAL